MCEGPALLPHHWEQLTKGSGIAPEVIAERGYRSILSPWWLSQRSNRTGSPGHKPNLPGLLLPALDHGRQERLDGLPA